MADENIKTAGAPHFTKLAAAFRPVRSELAFQFEHFAGRGSEEVIHNAEGCRLTADVVLARFSRVDPYTLAIRLGEAWYEIGRVSLDDPAIHDLPIVEYGPTPEQLAQQQRKDEAEAARIAAEAEYRRERQRLAEERRQRAEAHQVRVVEANRRRMGV